MSLSAADDKNLQIPKRCGYFWPRGFLNNTRPHYLAAANNTTGGATVRLVPSCLLSTLFNVSMRHSLNLKALSRKNEQQVILIERKPQESPLVTLERVWMSISHVGSQLEITLQSKTFSKRKKSSDCLDLCLREMAESPNESMKFTAIVKILKLLIHQLHEGTVCTLRDVYYRNVVLFKGKQCHLNKILDLVADSLGLLLQTDLKIFPSPKGIMWSTTKTEICIGTDRIISLNPNEDPVLISHTSDLEKILMKEEFETIMVFEKEAILKSFVSYLRIIQSDRALLLITGKGYPDRATTSFIRGLHSSRPETRFIFFVDSDVYGLQIFYNYVYQSSSLLRVAKLGGAFIAEERSEWMTMGKRDWARSVRFAQRNLQHIIASSNEKKTAMASLQRELLRSMILFKKAEINSVRNDSDTALGVNSYLWSKIPRSVTAI